MSPFDHEREHYRIMYPTAARPRLVGGGSERDVVDLCEQGLRYRATDRESPVLGDEITGTVHFRRGEELDVAGFIIRIVDREVALRLTRGVPLLVVLDEQRYLREHFRGSAW